MIALLLAFIGLPAGIALERIVIELAVPPDVDEEEATPDEPSKTKRRPAGAEAGSLVIDPDHPIRDWRRRLLIVAVTMGLFAAAGARYDEPSHLAVVTAYVCVLIICAATDLLVFRVPNVVTYPAMLGALAVAAAMPDASLPSAAAGAGLAGGALLLPALMTGGLGMGMGDVKLAIFVGLALGFTLTVPALVVMALTGGAVAAFLLVTRARKRGQPIPYAPFIAIGALTVLLWQGAAFVSFN